MKLTFEIKKGSKLNFQEIKVFNQAIKKEFNGAPLTKFHYKNTDFVFLKKEKSIVAVGKLIPIKINYINKNYNILGIGSIASINKHKGYGRILIAGILKYLKDKGKTGVGFCSRENSYFYEKCGFKINRNIVKRFKLAGKTKEEKDKEDENSEDNPDILFYEGKDKFFKKVLTTKSNIMLKHFW